MTSARWRAAALLVAALLPISACGGEDPGLQPGEVDVDVDTPELRTLKKSAGIQTCPPTTAAAADDGFPDTTLPCLGGGPQVNVATLRGPLVVNFWASWCGPCRRELPYYQEFHERYADQVAVIGIDYNDPQPRAALELARDTGVTFPLLADPATQLGEDLTIPGLPGIAFIDAQGRLVEVLEGSLIMFEEIDSLDELEALVEQHLGVTL